MKGTSVSHLTDYRYVACEEAGATNSSFKPYERVLWFFRLSDCRPYHH
jgi:hypothetical protein